VDPVTLLAGILVALGLVGVALPILPGLPLVWAGVLVWALHAHTPGAWVVLGIATAFAVVGLVLKYALPGRRMRDGGVRSSTTLAGVGLGVVGFFVIPVVGLVVGFLLGTYLAELARHRDPGKAWPATVVAVKAVGLSVGIELLTGLAMATTWLAGVALT
jgi:uncharacterized protein